MTSQQIYFIHALSPLHAGTGQGTGVIDLPIAREKATNIPIFPGSSLKGALRGLYDSKSKEEVEEAKKIFGEGGDFGCQGSVLFSDAHLLLLPVRSVKGVFAWVTCPYVLNRFCRDFMKDAGSWSVKDNSKCIVLKDSALQVSGSKVCLEEIDLNAEEISTLYPSLDLIRNVFSGDRRNAFDRHFCIVSDDVFSFLLTTSMEIVARIKIKDDSKTTEKGSLWYEEALPVESILYGIAVLSPVPKAGLREEDLKKKLNICSEKTIQLGGKTTVGRGLCKITFTDDI